MLATRMKTTCDPNGSKRPVDLSLNEALVAQVRQRQLHEAEARRLKRTAATWNAFADGHGSFTDEFSTL